MHVRYDLSPHRAVLAAILVSAGLVSTGASAAAVTRAVGHLEPGTIVTRGGLSAVVPPRGEGVGADAWLAGGGSISLRVQTRTDGRVVVTTQFAGPGPVTPTTNHVVSAARGPRSRIQGSPPPCQDAAHNLTGSWWRTTVNWLFKASTTPVNLSRDAARRAIKSGASHITHAFNDCGRADTVSATSHFAGATTLSPNIGPNSTCRDPDGQNVIGFGDLLGSQLGLTCWWFRGTTTVEADMKFNKRDFTWTTAIAGCTNEYLLQAVATHEFGHVFGLGHVSEANHGNLTMSTSMFACDNSPSTLGLGDMLGLEARY